MTWFSQTSLDNVLTRTSTKENKPWQYNTELLSWWWNECWAGRDDGESQLVRQPTGVLPPVVLSQGDYEKYNYLELNILIKNQTKTSDTHLRLGSHDEPWTQQCSLHIILNCGKIFMWVKMTDMTHSFQTTMIISSVNASSQHWRQMPQLLR